MTAPRQLLGWTVPDHFTITTGTGGIHHVTCRHLSHEGGWPGWVVRESQPNAAEKLAIFLRHNAHGETVEPLEGVLPETPEPPAKIFAPWNSETALTLIDFQQVGHLHPFTCPRDHGGQFALVANNGGWFCPADKCDYTQNWAWAFMADRSAWPDSPIWPIPAPQSSPVPLLPLSAPVETEGGEGGDTEALRADVALTIAESLKGSTEEDFFRAAAAVIADFGRRGWRPPPCNCLPFDVCDKCWGPEQQRESQMQQLAYCEEIIPCGPEDADQCQNLREPGSVHCAQHQSSPLPADEVEWGYRYPDQASDDTWQCHEVTARGYVATSRNAELMQRRAAGPWVAVPVEPKETK